ncbi:ATP-binding protein [Actinoalloteichus hymeniacidonis]|uniref:ATPase family protein associated with various cellular activities (AAA) n=1 Tax=Actinoalloteichus hymeniacidonis TaxID=340345 RepID=A0AAC9HRM4_9PSEU|nr:ATP-binding protein [Actinoalloteichus hymeniacidonis]AOS64312.1 ATPase family protein associated with various cellular activities (AAA) [Actinoalloteichus hymeniacidonis]MBB5907620.1 hypothetical protein [Actinoalloteichus hymeniacidonis]
MTSVAEGAGLDGRRHATADSRAAELRELLGGLALVEHRVHRLIEARGGAEQVEQDPYRGLYLSDDEVARILADRPDASTGLRRSDSVGEEPAGFLPDDGSRLASLARRFGLDRLDVEFLLIALAPEVDSRFERLYAYLNDDVTRTRATVGLALSLVGLPQAGHGRFRLTEGAPLLAGGLLVVQDGDRPMLTRSLRVPDRVIGHLLGHDRMDPALAGVLRQAAGDDEDPDPLSLARRLGVALAAGPRLIYLRDPDGDAGRQAVAALAAAHRAALIVDPVGWNTMPESAEVVPLIAREARLRAAGVILGPLDRVDFARPGQHTRLLRDLADLAEHTPVLFHGRREWDPEWTAELPIVVPVPPISGATREAAWSAAVAEVTGEGAAATVPEANLAAYRLSPEQVRRAVGAAAGLALVDGAPLNGAHLRAGVRAYNAAGLDRLARRITPAVGWDDLVLPASTRRQLSELLLRAVHRDTVLGRWRMRPGGGRGRGVLALFAGESGTGKTMSAEVLAAELGLELYIVDLSTVVDKYVGETEKNLDRIFTEAAGVNGVLLFDEADAIFGRRSEVRDSHDKHANMESAYLLQRMESFDGIAVLTTNLRANLDEAFIRRLDVVADFPMPDAPQRLALWDRCLGTELPRADDLDLRFCAESFELAGGSIRACALTAAYLAAEADAPLSMAQLINAIRQEYRKLGRLVLAGEFGTWLETSE